MRKFGLKLWSKDFIKNKEFVKDAEVALKNGKFDYLELFALPFSFDETKDDVKANFGGVKTVIHAAHSLQGLDISNKDEFDNNQKRIEDAKRFADLMDAEFIILHPGMNEGEEFLEESIRQFRAFNDKRLTVENLPTYCSQTKKKLHGVTPFEIRHFIEELDCPFCLDFSHAICGANALDYDVYSFLNEMVKLRPSMYHLCDGFIRSDNDSHLHFGMGNYDLKKLINQYTRENALITMETGHGIPQSVKPWIDDINYLKGLLDF
ncbi:MAG: TIM barrel protein [Alphaproteobacteria bacterium]|nr:TIM barrel protein [Alphaproteobacteria bacterium]